MASKSPHKYLIYSLYYCTFFLTFCTQVTAQEDCGNFTETPIPFCQCTDCGDIDPVWETVGTSTICEGSPFQLTGENSTPQNFIEDYHWYFIDISSNEIIDQFVYTDPELPPYIYELQSDNPPDCDETSVFISVVLITTSESCAEGESCRRALKDLEILLEPRAGFEPLQQECVDTEVSFTNQSCYADSYSWDFGDNSPASNETNPSHTYQNPGVYEVTLYAYNSNCTSEDSMTRTIEIVGFPEADYSYTATPENQCEPSVFDFVGLSNQWSNTSWCINPVDTLAWCLVDTNATMFDDEISVEFKKCGKYEVIFKASNVCDEVTASDSIEVFCQPFINVCTPDVSCDEAVLTCDDLCFNFGGAITNIEWQFENANISSSSGECFGPVTFTESGQITVTAHSPCGELIDSVNVIVANTDPIIFHPDNPSSICPEVTLIQFQSDPVGIWSPSSIITTDGYVNPGSLGTGNYSITVSTGATECPNMSSTTFTVLDSFSVSISNPAAACEQAVIVPSDLSPIYSGVEEFEWIFENGSIPGFNGADFPPVTFNQSGSIILNAFGECGTAADTVEVIVIPETIVMFGNNPAELCNTSNSIQLSATPSPGGWSSPGLPPGALNSSGELDPFDVPAGTYELVYTPTGDCIEAASISLSIIASEAISVEDTTICIDSGPVTLEASHPGGTWSGIGITDTVLGIFDPSGLNADTFLVDYLYFDTNQCPVSVQAEVLVEALPTINVPDSIQLCLSDIDVDLPNLLNFNVDPEGGESIWSGTGIIDQNLGIFNSLNSNLSEGLYDVYITYTRNDCMVNDTVVIEIIENIPLMLTPDTVVCINDMTLQLESNLEGGDWSGPGIDNDGLIDLTMLTNDTFEYSYVLLPNSSCEQTANTFVAVIDLSDTVDAGPDIEICDTISSYNLNDATPVGGTWDGEYIDINTGLIDLTQLIRDSLYTYSYCIESDAIDNCQACDSRTFIIRSNPEASFELDGLPCIDEEFQLVNNSSIVNDDVPLSYLWDFGDLSPTSGKESPFHAYDTPGIYTVTLIVTSTENCKDTLTQEFNITTKPTASFEIIGDKEGCAPFLIQVDNNSSGDGISQYWCVGGDTIYGAALEDIYLDSITTDSIFKIVLKVENLCGTVTDEDEVLVHPYPIVDFGISSDEGCSPLEIDFSNVTLGNPDSLEWIISNDSSYTTFEPPIQTFTTSDTIPEVYTVTLIATNECGEDTLSKDITVFPPDVRAFIELDTLSGCQPFTVNPKCFATPGAIVNWLVFDEEGNVQGSELKDPEFILSTPGTHTIVLIATNPDCGSHNDTAYIEVLPAPTVSFDHQTWVCLGDTVFFINNSINIGGTSWDFGDDSTSLDYSPFHIYDAPGTYSVSLIGYSLDNGCPATHTSEVLVRPNPVAAFTPDTLEGCLPLSVSLQNQSVNADDFIWDFGDNTSLSFEENPTHTYENAGTYTVLLTVFDEFECSADTTLFSIKVYGLPQSQFYFDNKPYCHRYDSLHLINTSIDAVAYEWVFQGDTFNIENPIILPDSSGVFEINLTVWNNDGCSHSSVQTIEILESPIADAILQSPFGCQPLKLIFENNSIYSDTYFWDFDNGNTSTDFAPEHTYDQPGNYWVTLTSSNLNGCPDDIDSLELEVWPKPEAAFDFEKEEECGSPVLVTFENNSIDNSDNDWDFGDGSSLPNVIHPEHEFTNPGNYPVELIVENDFGCLDTLIKIVEIYGQPDASFDIVDSVGCEDLTVKFMNTSIDGLSFNWAIDSFPELTEISPEVVFENPGTYGVQLIAIYNDVCQDTIYKPGAIKVYQTPFANFSHEVNNDENIIGDVEFTNLSLNADRYLWDFGDGQFSDETSPFHEYDINRSIDVLLTAYNDNGGAYVCTDDTLVSISPEWIATFFAPNVLSPDSGEDKVRVFKPVGIGLRDYKISVYSPWGDLVWYSEALNNHQPTGEWDGTQNGTRLPQGTYVWMADITFLSGESRIEKGTVTIIR